MVFQVLCAAVLLSACFSPVCPEPEPILLLDGGTAVCLRAESCPRPSDLFVCTTTGDIANVCVACQNTQCVRLSPGVCR